MRDVWGAPRPMVLRACETSDPAGHYTGFWDFGSATDGIPYDLSRTLCATRVFSLLHDRHHGVPLVTLSWSDHELSRTQVSPTAYIHALHVRRKLTHHC